MDCLFASVMALSPYPELYERDRFPPRIVACEALEFNRAYRRHVEGRQTLELHHWWHWQEVLGETDYLYHCWDTLHAAQGGEGSDEDYCRSQLQRLKELLGEQAYFLGVMPMTVPVWRFRAIE